MVSRSRAPRPVGGDRECATFSVFGRPAPRTSADISAVMIRPNRCHQSVIPACVLTSAAGLPQRVARAAALDVFRRPGARQLSTRHQTHHVAMPTTERAGPLFEASHGVPPNRHDHRGPRGHHPRSARCPGEGAGNPADKHPARRPGQSTCRPTNLRAHHRSGPRVGQVVLPRRRGETQGVPGLPGRDDPIARHRIRLDAAGTPKRADCPGRGQRPNIRPCGPDAEFFRESRRRHRGAVGDQSGRSQRRRPLGVLRIHSGRQCRIRKYQLCRFGLTGAEFDAVHRHRAAAARRRPDSKWPGKVQLRRLQLRRAALRHQQRHHG